MFKSFKDGDTMLSRFDELVKEDPEKAVFIFWNKNEKRTVLTRQALWDKSMRCAAVLRRWGIVKGDIVCNTLVNSQERLITSLGTIFAGAISMHGQLFLADGEDIMKNWKDSKCKAVIVDPNQKKGAASILDRIKDKDEKTGECLYKGLPFLTHVIPVVMGDNGDTGSWLQSLDDETDTYTDDSITQDDVSYIFTTSGSTGFAKLVPHTHKTILAIVEAVSSFLDLRPDSVYFNHRSFGWMGGVPLLIFIGVPRVVVDHSLGMPEDLGNLIVKIFNHENCDSTFLLPSDIQLVLNTLDSGVSINHQLRIVFSGGGPLSTVSMSAIGRFTDRLIIFYASSECGLIYSLTVKDSKSYENSCVGYAAPSVETKILGDNLEELPYGETGEIFIRSPTIAKGYLNNIEQSEETFGADGWFRSNDMGHFNAQGQLFVYCRKNNAINHKGFIHYPGWMENRINTHPLIQRSTVIGIPDPVNHEDICLCIIKSSPQANLTPEDAREFCKTLFLTSEKDLITPIPKYYLFFDAFPTNSNGKFDRKTLRAEALRRLEK